MFVSVREAQKLKGAYLDERRRRQAETEMSHCKRAPLVKAKAALASAHDARRGLQRWARLSRRAESELEARPSRLYSMSSIWERMWPLVLVCSVDFLLGAEVILW